MQNKVQLITYANRFGGDNLGDLFEMLQGPLRGLFGGVHVLPFYLPIDGADAGFDPVDHEEVDPQIGSWFDIAAIANQYDVMADVIVNHVSADSPRFRDYRSRGESSPYHGLFLTREDVFPNGFSDADMRRIYRPRPGLPFTKIVLEDGRERMFWTTFTSQQVDINVNDVEGRRYLDAVLSQLHNAGVRAIRLDAVGYAIKKPGTSCFMIPETFSFIDALTSRAKELEMGVLVEVHSYYRRQIEIAGRVDRVYDFALPPLVLHAFAFQTAMYLKEWIGIRPPNAITVLDTHDGIGIIDVGAEVDGERRPGLVPPEELDRLVEVIHENTRGESRLATGQAASNLDLYQVNSTFFDAMGRNDQVYLLARAVQFFLPGIPQVYYVGLMAGLNDVALLSRTGVGRDINRHYYTREEIASNLQRPVVRDLCNLIRLRNQHPAFEGEFSLEETGDNVLEMRWSLGKTFAVLTVDFMTRCGELTYSDLNQQGYACRWEIVPNGGMESCS